MPPTVAVPGEVVRAQNLSKTFGSHGVEVHALRGVDLSVPQRQCVAIMGPSGSGKSTFLHIVGGIEVPSGGQVWVGGTELSSLSDRDRTLLRRRRMGFVFQSFNLLPTLDIVQNVALPLLLDGVSRSEAVDRAKNSLQLVKMVHRLRHMPTELSGGEQQRVAIARAIVTRPPLLLADEPTGNLDTANANKIMALLRQMVDEQNHSIVLVTHDPRISARADRVVRFLDGQIRYDGPPSAEALSFDEISNMREESP